LRDTASGLSSGEIEACEVLLVKIFWSWQSDHPGNISRHFVREALEATVIALNEDLAIEEPEREITLDHDRKGVPGSPDLASVILEKIRGSDVFVADVTPVGLTGNDPPRSVMNPNVAIELGYALHTISDRRLIMVMNATFGARADLPFDLRHKAGPLFYRLKPGANKDEIEAARARLAGEFKVALREILPTLLPVTRPFAETSSRPNDPSRFFQPRRTLAVRGEAFIAEETPILYLRVIPTKPTEPLKRAAAISLVRQGSPDLNPFYYHRSGSSFEPNGFGAIAFDAVYDRHEIISAAQLFLNREIWAFNTVSLSPELAKSRTGRLGIPTLSVEQTFALMLPQYLRFMNDRLGVPPPYRIEGGAAGIKDYVIFTPGKFVDQQWGPIHQNHVSWSGTLASLDAKEVDIALLNIFEAIFDAGACTRPQGLYGFPGETPGTLPSDRQN
jgi:hypothetical protein